MDRHDVSFENEVCEWIDDSNEFYINKYFVKGWNFVERLCKINITKGTKIKNKRRKKEKLMIMKHVIILPVGSGEE